MIFKRGGKWYEVSQCGQYTISAASCDGRFLFCAHRVVERKPGELLMCFATAEEARECCADHALKQPIPEMDLPVLMESGR